MTDCGAPSPRSSLRWAAWGRSPSPAKKSRTGDGFYLGRAQVHGGMRLCTSSCRTCCPTNEASPYRTVRHNDRRLDACRLAAVSSRPRKRARWNLVEVAASRTEEDDRTFPCDDCFDGESIRQCERVPTLFTRAADHPRWVETHLRQVLQSVGGYHDALACF